MSNSTPKALKIYNLHVSVLERACPLVVLSSQVIVCQLLEDNELTSYCQENQRLIWLIFRYLLTLKSLEFIPKFDEEPVNRYHLPVKNGTTQNNNLIEFKVNVFWMSLILEVDKPVKPTDISLLCTVAYMICANYFSGGCQGV